ncbi:hypothetical protein [Phyllobacterium meliloti]|uniref:hypothetical protein n=1 Tax=Phyllobacterium meliloti TaxID=555317 RepID=UPI001D145F72|nr:hypothetical protein [Phyllobacterium sp. T1293]UGX87103.1 hypothetical protein LLE53_004450 [Phyllobacterium sp. T1293]
MSLAVRITSMRTFNDQRDGASLIAKFDLTIEEQIQIFGCALFERLDGVRYVVTERRTSTNSANTRNAGRVAYFGYDLSARILAAAEAAYAGFTQAAAA